MPRATYGPQVKARTQRVLELLLRCANQEFETEERLVQCRWQEDGKTATAAAPHTLVVQTSLRGVQSLNQQLYPSAPLSKPQIREALRRLQDFLGWLEDYRVHQRGTEDWHFALHLPAKATETVLAQAAQAWESRRSSPVDHQASPHPPAKDWEVAVPSDLPPAPPGLLQGVPFQAPPLPLYFVPRPEPCQAVKGHLLAQTAQRSGTLVVSAIQGLGGIGKSVLASSLAHDPEVQSRFCDGVLWTTLGQQPDILACLSGWIQELGDHSYKPTTPASASAHLRTLLHDKRMLLVVDDVWDAAHAEPFRVGGPHGCVLITTREARIQGCLRYDLDVMTPEQALALLTQAIQEELSASDLQDAMALAKAVAYLPLALELAAAQIEDGATWAELLEALQREIADLDVLDIEGFGFASQATKQRNLSLLASFNLSLKRLPPEQLTQFAWLGVLPEDVTITEAMVATLWDMGQTQARTLLRFFKSRALLLSGGRQTDQRLGYRLHDLMHDVARHLLTGAAQPTQPGMLPGVGLTLPAAHQQLLDRYRRQLSQGQWPTLPRDGYIHTYLTWHLEQAGLGEEIHQLLQATSATGHNGWYQVCRDLGQTASFIGDVARAWRLAEQQFLTVPAQALGLQCRYALMKGSLNTLVGNLPPELITVLVAEGIWQPAQGLAHLQQIPKPWRQAHSFKILLPYIPDSLLPEALQVVRGIADPVCRSVMLIALSRRLPDLRPEALRQVDLISEDFQRAVALGCMATYEPSLWPQVLDRVQAACPERDQGSILQELVADMPPVVLAQALEVAVHIQDPYSRAIGMAAIARQNPAYIPTALDHSLEAARTIDNVYRRAWALSALATLDSTLWPEAIAQIRQIEHEFALARLIKNLAADFPPAQVPEMIAIAQSIQHEARRVIALGSLCPREPSLWPSVLADTQVMRDSHRQAQALVALAAKVSTLWPQAVDFAQTIRPQDERAMAYSALATLQPEFWPQAQQATLAIGNACYRAIALNELATALPDLWPQTLADSRAFQHAFDRVQLLHDLACKLPQLWPETLAAICDLWFERQQSQLIYDAILDMPADRVTEVIPIAEGLRDDFERLLAFSALAMRLPEWLAPTLAQLQRLTPQIEQGTQAAIVAMVQGALAIAGHTPWAEVLTAIQAIDDENWRAQVIYNMATKFPATMLPSVVGLLFHIQADYYRAYAFEEILPRLDLSTFSYQEWCDTLQTLASLDRDYILALIPSLSDSILALGGEAAIIEVAQAIQAVGQQW